MLRRGKLETKCDHIPICSHIWTNTQHWRWCHYSIFWCLVIHPILKSWDAGSWCDHNLIKRDIEVCRSAYSKLWRVHTYLVYILPHIRSNWWPGVTMNIFTWSIKVYIGYIHISGPRRRYQRWLSYQGRCYTSIIKYKNTENTRQYARVMLITKLKKKLEDM